MIRAKKSKDAGRPPGVLVGLPSRELDVLWSRQTVPLEVVEDRRRVPDRVTVPVRTELPASRECVMRVRGVEHQPPCLRPAVRPSNNVLQLSPREVQR
jgi:hypothetical protein